MRRRQQAAAELLLARPLPATLRVRADGACMLPLFTSGATLTVDTRAPVRTGDVVAVLGDDGWLRVHRFLGRLPSARGVLAVTAADGAQAVDVPVGADRLVGVCDLPVSLADRRRAGARFARTLGFAAARRLRRAVGTVMRR